MNGMKYAVTSQEMKIYDRNTSEHFGVATEVLMERASLAVADVVDEWRSRREAKRTYRVLVMAGVGNNGGDGVCVARLLKQRGYVVNLCVVGDPTKCSDLLLKQLQIAEKYGIHKDTFSNISCNKSEADFDIIVDGLFGIGLSRPVTGEYLDAVNYINSCKRQRDADLFLVSIDIASGISADDGHICGAAVRADATVTFNQAKIGHIMYPGCEYAGKLIIKDVGITEDSFLGKAPGIIYYDGEAKALLPERSPSGNKGTYGKVLIIAGSKDISGACLLCAGACLKAGAGMVRVFTAAENAEAVKTLLPEAILDTYEDFEPVGDKLNVAMKWSTQAVIGPGIGTEGKGRELLTDVLRFYDKSLVMDADALNIIAQDPDLFRLAGDFGRDGKRLIITPHMGEFARLFKSDIRDCKEHILQYPAELSKRLHCTVICKDARSVVADTGSKKIYINVSGNDGMATAGSGDVLSGILGAVLAYGLDGFESAIAGAYIHGRAGDAAAEKIGRHSMVASDIAMCLPEVLR
jgi:NAD(P)H-hydrate epimerase